MICSFFFAFTLLYHTSAAILVQILLNLTRKLKVFVLITVRNDIKIVHSSVLPSLTNQAGRVLPAPQLPEIPPGQIYRPYLLVSF